MKAYWKAQKMVVQMVDVKVAKKGSCMVVVKVETLVDVKVERKALK